MRKCVFFDRDGIVNESPGPGYVEKWEDFKLLPDFVDLLGFVLKQGYVAVIVTNQRGVARGLVQEAEVVRIHTKLRDLLWKEHRLSILDILYCPHGDEMCDCRKPKAGMLFEAARRHGIDLSASWMVGDSERDIEAGRTAGCRTILVSSGAAPSAADFRVDSLKAVESLLGEP